jgi:hypothetical protein
MFDYEFYKKHNDDLIKKGIISKLELIKYHLKYGRKEGRLGCLTDFDNKFKDFNKDDYIRYNRDLEFMNEESLKVHYSRYRKSEGRIGSIFDLIDICRTLLPSLPKKFEHIKNKENLINILIRSSGRSTIKKTLDSIFNQNYSNFKVIVCFDNINALKFLADYNVNYFKIEKNDDFYGFNLYCNELLEKVESGYIMFLDDDDMFVNSCCLNYINGFLHKDNILVWKFFRPDKIIYPKNVNNIKFGEIASCAYMFHSKYKTLSKWTAKRGGDFDFFKNLEQNKVFVNEILTRTTYLDKSGSFGDNMFIDFDFYRKNNPDLNHMTEIDTVEHYYRHGINENRIIEPLLFNIKTRNMHISKTYSVIYLIDKSLEQTVSGYTIKSDHTINYLEKVFNKVYVVIKPSKEDEFKKKSKYIYLSNRAHQNIDNKFLQIYYDELFDVVEMTKPFLIISCSNYINGYIGNLICKSFNIRSIYEVRGLWEITQETIDHKYVDTYLYKQAITFETKVCIDADQIWVINKELGYEIIKRGIDKNKIITIPFYVYSKNNMVHIKNNKKNICYCGTFTKYENLQTFIELGKLIKKYNKNFIINMIGSKNKWFKDLVQKNDLNDTIIVSDEIEYTNIDLFLKNQDIAIITREPSRVSNIVLPMKILDHIYYNHIIISTNIEPIRTIMNNKAYYYTNVNDLFNIIQCVELIDLSELRKDRYTEFIKNEKQQAYYYDL